MAINYFTHQGYTVSIPMNDTQWYDLVIEKDGNFKTVQCKATQTKNNAINLKVLVEHEVLFTIILLIILNLIFCFV